MAKKKENKEQKSPIDYLQFLNRPELDDNKVTWFFTYLDPITEEIKRYQNDSKRKVDKKYSKMRDDFIKIQKDRKVTIVTDVVVDTTKKKKKRTDKNRYVAAEINTKALELKIQGYNMSNIVASLMQTYSITKAVAVDSAYWAYHELAKTTDEDYIRLVVNSHSELYDELYRKFIELSAPKLAMRALKVKEALNGVGQDIFEIQVNNVYEPEQDLIGYGMNKLTDDEQKEFVKILNRIQRINNEKQKQLKAA